MISGALWFRYFLPITTSQSYHAAYFGFALLPGVLLSLLLFGIRTGPRWLRIASAALTILALPLWLLSVAVVENNFKIH